MEWLTEMNWMGNYNHIPKAKYTKLLFFLIYHVNDQFKLRLQKTPHVRYSETS